MPMELRKRKAPTQPPASAPAKKTKTAPAKRKAAPKAEENKKTVAPVKKAAAKKETKKAVEKKEAAPTPAPAAEKAPEPEVKPAEAAKAESPAAKEPAASASTTATYSAAIKTGRAKFAVKATKDADAKADAKTAKADAVPKLKVGDTLPTDLAEITLDDGTKTTFSSLLDASEKGIVLFSYTKASTTGCTTQACALRDNYAQFKDAGYLIYGLSGDSHADNAKFRTKHNLGYPLLSDPTYVFHEALGIKSAKGTVRSVIVVQKEGKIIKELKSVMPRTSLDVARKAVGIEAPEEEKKETKKETKKEREAKAKDVAVGKEPPTSAAPAEAPAATTEEAAKPAESS
ncbi:thioredoxin-like protein [Terfezia claveryi]|nr:thioredoxin-like protein [Terfezia claveryi]